MRDSKKREYIVSMMSPNFSINLLRFSSPGPSLILLGGGHSFICSSNVLITYSTCDTISGTRERRVITTQFLPSTGSRSRNTKNYNGSGNKGLPKTHSTGETPGSREGLRSLPTGCEEAGTEKKDISGRWDGTHRGTGGGGYLHQRCFPDLLGQCLTHRRPASVCRKNE